MKNMNVLKIYASYYVNTQLSHCLKGYKNAVKKKKDGFQAYVYLYTFMSHFFGLFTNGMNYIVN